MAKLNYNYPTFGLLAGLLLFVTGCESSKKYKDCEDYKTGVFKYNDKQFEDWEVTRTKTTQTEINENLGVAVVSKVKWLSDCEYLLILDKTKSSDIYASMADTLRVEFKEIKDHSVIYVATGRDLENEGEMIKVQ